MGQENRLHPVLALGTGLDYGPSFPGSPPPSPFPVHQTASTPKRKPLSPKNSMSTPVNGFFDFENNSSAKISPTCCDCRCGCGGDYEWQAFDQTEAYGQHILPSKHCQMSISKTWLRREGKGKGKEAKLHVINFSDTLEALAQKRSLSKKLALGLWNCRIARTVHHFALRYLLSPAVIIPS